MTKRQPRSNYRTILLTGLLLLAAGLSAGILLSLTTKPVPGKKKSGRTFKPQSQQALLYSGGPTVILDETEQSFDKRNLDLPATFLRLLGSAGRRVPALRGRASIPCRTLRRHTWKGMGAGARRAEIERVLSAANRGVSNCEIRRALQGLPVSGGQYASRLAALLRSADQGVARAVTAALSRLGPEALPHLKILLRNPNPIVRGRAVRVLGRLKFPGRARFIDSLRSDPSATVRGAVYAAIALQRRSPDYDPAAALFRTFASEDPRMQRRILWLSLHLKDQSPSAAASILEAYHSASPDSRLRVAALNALGNGRLMSPATRQLLLKLASRGHGPESLAAIHALGRGANVSKAALNLLATRLRNGNCRTQLAAAWALSRQSGRAGTRAAEHCLVGNAQGLS